MFVGMDLHKNYLQIAVLNKPVISITPSVAPPNGSITSYTTDFKNSGSQASHVRLTLFYPNTTIRGNTIIYKNENMTMKEEGPSSVVVFLPRLVAGRLKLRRMLVVVSLRVRVIMTPYWITPLLPTFITTVAIPRNRFPSSQHMIKVVPYISHSRGILTQNYYQY